MINPLNDKSFEILFREYFRPLVYFAFQFVKDKDNAEDIVQEVFVSVYERKEMIAIESSGINYLYTSVRNRCVDYIRSKKLHVEKSKKVRDAFGSNQDDPLEKVAMIEFEHKYVQALESLSPKCRKVFKLSRMEGKNNSEIAADLNLSKRTVEKHISLALRILRKKLKIYLND